MTMGEWIDSTSYRRGERAGGNPRTLTLEVVTGMHITVTKHIHFDDEWTARAPELGIDRVGLGTEDLRVAKTKALEICLNLAKEKAARFEEASHELKELVWQDRNDA